MKIWSRATVLRLALVFAAPMMRAQDGKTLPEETRRYHELQQELFAQEQRGQKNLPAHQISFELGWLISNVHDHAPIRERLDAFAAAIRDPANATAVDEQSPEDGAWGRWYTSWAFKLDASYEQIVQLADDGQVPKYPCRFLDRINSPETLTAHLDHLLISEPAVDGVNRRRELNETISDLLRMIHRHLPANYAYHPQLDATLLDWLLNRARDPATGYWGGWYRRGGQIEKTTDLSITFHIVSYLEGNVPDWPKLIDTTLAIKDRKYPTGWLDGGTDYTNHNNMDVVRLFELGWPRASAAQRTAIRGEIRKMVDWCLRDSLRADGSFVMNGGDDSVETSIYFGTQFLARAGYFNRKRRFWTDEDFPRAAEDKKHILEFIRQHFSSGGEGGGYYRNALTALGEPPPKP